MTAKGAFDAVAALEARGPFVQTWSGHAFYPFDPKPDEVEIEDIAHALANSCRFNGHCEVFYSIAQHAYVVSNIVPPADALAGLLHDAAEAYVGDMVRPLKIRMPDFDAVEHRIWLAIAERYGLDPELPETVRRADDVMLATEWRDLMVQGVWKWQDFNVKPLEQPIEPVNALTARTIFLDRFYQLTRPASVRRDSIAK